MTSRDLAFWLQGFYELTMHSLPGSMDSFVPAADCVRKHAELVLVTEPASSFAISVKHLADKPAGLRDLVSAQFEHVIDKTFPPPEQDPAHKPAQHLTLPNNPSSFLMRC